MLEDYEVVQEIVHQNVKDFILNYLCKTGITILYVNIRNLHRNLYGLGLLLARLNTKPNIIVCSDTRKPQFDFNISGYDMHFNDSTNICDGVVVYIQSSLRSFATRKR